MKQPVGRGTFSQPYVATIIMGRSLLLVSSGAVRRLHHESFMARIKKWVLSISRVYGEPHGERVGSERFFTLSNKE